MQEIKKKLNLLDFKQNHKSILATLIVTMTLCFKVSDNHSNISRTVLKFPVHLFGELADEHMHF